jgi:hypothetical protein
MMHMPIVALFVIAAALLGETQASDAQSAYSYPWCAIYDGSSGGGGGAMSCYYASREQCRTTMYGIGGYCVESPFYRAQATEPPHHPPLKPGHRRHAE